MQTKKQFIKDMIKDDMIDDIFVVKFKKPVEQYKRGYKFELRIGDSSKEIMFKYWGGEDENTVKALYDSINKDDVVQVSGRINEWNDKLEISANDRNTIKILKEGEYDVKDFIRRSEKDPEQMWQELNVFIDSIKNEELKKIVDYFFKDEKFISKFKESPAAMYIHHGWIHGLMEHTLDVIKIADLIQKLHPTIDRDLLLTGALFHDIGKLREFEVKTSIRVSTEGILIGHVTIAIEMINEAAKKEGIPEETAMKIKHLVLTHMGEYGSSKTPSMPEALALFQADQTSAQMDHMIDLKENAQTEDNFIYNKDLGNIYLG